MPPQKIPPTPEERDIYEQLISIPEVERDTIRLCKNYSKDDICWICRVKRNGLVKVLTRRRDTDFIDLVRSIVNSKWIAHGDTLKSCYDLLDLWPFEVNFREPLQLSFFESNE